NSMVSVDLQRISRGPEIRYFIRAVCHSLARMTGQSSHNRSRESTNIVGLVSGKLGVSASVNRLIHFLEPRARRAPSTLTSSARRPPDPWYQQTKRSPPGSSTIVEA